MPAVAAHLSDRATARLKKPRTRGAFMPVDAARRQLGLLTVADGLGQARLYWLIDLATQEIADARFLAFGDLASHPVMDVFTELVRGRTVADACRLSAEQVEALLRDEDGAPAFGDAGLAPLAFLRQLQERAEAALPAVTLLPKPADAPAYVRKRKADWTPADEAWLPLNLLKKAARVEAVIGEVLEKHRRAGVTHRVDAINDDFRVLVRFGGLPEEQVPTVAKFLEDALRGRCHPEITVEPQSAQ